MIELNGVRDALGTLTTAVPRFYRAPGGVTLVGDHVEATEGFLLPLAIDRATVTAAAPRDDRMVRVRSVERAQTVAFSLDDGCPAQGEVWIGIVQRTAEALERRGAVLRGADVAVRSTIPLDAGLAASAALSVASALALLGTAGADLPVADVVDACREVDGAIAPLTLAMGRREHALLVDARNGEATMIPLAFEGTAIVVCDSQTRRPNAAAVEAERRLECDEAATILRTELPKVKTLRDVSLADFLRHGERLPATLRRRTRHVVTENVRVLQTVAAVRGEDPIAAGGRMNESHDSLRDDFEISTPELDLLVSAARSVPGVYGSRMTGRGCGGATVSLVRRDALPTFRTAVTAVFRGTFGRDPAILEVRAADGAAPIA